MLLSASLLMYASPSHRNRPKADQKTSTSIDKLTARTSRIIGTLFPLLHYPAYELSIPFYFDILKIEFIKVVLF